MSGYGDFRSKSRSVLSASTIGGLGLVAVGVKVREVIQPVTRRDNKVGRGVCGFGRCLTTNKPKRRMLGSVTRLDLLVLHKPPNGLLNHLLARVTVLIGPISHIK